MWLFSITVRHYTALARTENTVMIMQRLHGPTIYVKKAMSLALLQSNSLLVLKTVHVFYYTSS